MTDSPSATPPSSPISLSTSPPVNPTPVTTPPLDYNIPIPPLPREIPPHYPRMAGYIPQGVVDLPLPGTKGAPKKFKGKFSEVDQFLYFYERLCQKCHVTRDIDKIENIAQYCSRPVKEVLEGLSSYTAGRWSDFVKDIRKFFEADKDAKRYKVRDLEEFTNKMRRKNTVPSLDKWNKYNRGFIRIAGWLKKEGRVSDHDFNFYYWGIRKEGVWNT